MSENKSGNGAFLLGAIVGGVVGAATAIFLSSEKGKKLWQDMNNENMEKLKMTAIELFEMAKDKTKQLTKSSAVTKDEDHVKIVAEQHDSGVSSIPIPLHTESAGGNNVDVEKMLKEAEAAFADAENKLNNHNGKE
ncbi:YtxH-like protein [Anoxybacillus vitaminiphilus]|uniref:YtxH-like protein n=1 Tax=Paranoxybacillus vitaminiphilus TaxID=581036 RepID=A0A327YJS6_9BACL|nr:YtxH domain-containing protein [Anoxybacillus vitaminiphilus]RAK21210.1 YtxH-like protein [Anoxybacillus vitaminiphilus]